MKPGKLKAFLHGLAADKARLKQKEAGPIENEWTIRLSMGMSGIAL